MKYTRCRLCKEPKEDELSVLFKFYLVHGGRTRIDRLFQVNRTLLAAPLA